MNCQFDTDEMRCARCGYAADLLPLVRECRTLNEMARDGLEWQALHRVGLPPLPIGDAVAAMFEAVGVTKARFAAAVGGDCGCSGRQAVLNRVGEKVSAAVSALANAAANAVAPHYVSDEEVADAARELAGNFGTNRGLADAFWLTLDAPATVDGKRNSPDATQASSACGSLPHEHGWPAPPKSAVD